MPRPPRRPHQYSSLIDTPNRNLERYLPAQGLLTSKQALLLNSIQFSFEATIFFFKRALMPDFRETPEGLVPSVPYAIDEWRCQRCPILWPLALLACRWSEPVGLL